MIGLRPLQGQVGLLVEDLRRQVADDAGLRKRLEEEFAGAEHTATG